MDPVASDIVGNAFRFKTVDYLVFVVMLIASAVTGIYYGYFRRKRESDYVGDEEKKANIAFGSKSLTDYLLGSRELKMFPVAMSLVASYISGVSVLGTPSEVYNYGLIYWIIMLPIAISPLITNFIFLPVFFALKISSSYEYLEIRFSSKIRLIASIMFIINQVFYLPIVVYVPALAFNQVSGVNLHLIGAIVSIVCVFYTLIGGIRAVVATDAWQVLVMFASVIMVAVIGTIYQGGMPSIFETLENGGRQNLFDFDPSMYKRYTHIGLLIGFIIQFTAYNSVGQTMVQRYISLPTLKSARQAVYIFIVGVIMFMSLCVYTGILAYDAYSNCDPKTAGLIQADDQIFPLYVMQMMGNFPGVPGLFIAGVCCASLSSLSVIYNSASLVIYSDIVKGFFKNPPSERAATFWIKGSVLALGVLSVLGVFIVENMGGVIAAGNSLTALGYNGTLGLFILGMLVPWGNTLGAMCGAISALVMTGWMSFGAQTMLAAGRLGSQRLPMEWDDCPPQYGNLTNLYPEVDESDVFPLYRLSFWWYYPIGVGTNVLVGTIVSYFTNKDYKKDLDPQLISPIIRRFLSKETSKNFGSATKKYNNNL